MNMSYCQFENTYIDLKQCFHTLEDEGLPKSDTELDNAKRIAKLAKEYIDIYNQLNKEL